MAAIQSTNRPALTMTLPNAAASALVLVLEEIHRGQPSVVNAFTGEPVTHGYSLHRGSDGYQVLLWRTSDPVPTHGGSLRQ